MEGHPARVSRLESRTRSQDEARDEMLEQLEGLRHRVEAIEDEKRELRSRLENSEARCRCLDEEREDMKKKLSDLQSVLEPMSAEKSAHSEVMNKMSSLEERLMNLESCVKDEVHSVFMRMKSLLNKVDGEASPGSSGTPPTPPSPPSTKDHSFSPESSISTKSRSFSPKSSVSVKGHRFSPESSVFMKEHSFPPEPSVSVKGHSFSPNSSVFKKGRNFSPKSSVSRKGRSFSPKPSVSTKGSSYSPDSSISIKSHTFHPESSVSMRSPCCAPESAMSTKLQCWTTTESSSNSSLDSPTPSCRSIFCPSTSCNTLFSPPMPTIVASPCTSHRTKNFASDFTLINENPPAEFRNRRSASPRVGTVRNRLAESLDFLPSSVRAPPSQLETDRSQDRMGVADLFFDPGDRIIETVLTPREDSLMNKVANTISLMFQNGMEDHQENQMWSSIQWAMTKGLHQSLHRCLGSVPQNHQESWDIFDTETILGLLKEN